MDIEQQTTRVYDTLRAGGLAVVPTNAGYGLLAMGARAVERIYALKGRPASKPCITVTTWPNTAVAGIAVPSSEPFTQFVAREDRETPKSGGCPEPSSARMERPQSSQAPYAASTTSLLSVWFRVP